MSDRDAIEVFADHVVSTRLEDIPADAVEAAKVFLLDSLGVGLVGTRAPYVEEWLAAHETTGGNTESRVWGHPNRLSALAAAAVNGFLIHNSEYDCVHEAAVLHPMAVTLSALMAEADARGGISGAELLRALILGVDVACHIGNAVTSGLKFFRPATGGGFGATAALGAIAGLDRDALLDAFGLYYAQAGGTMQAHVEGLPLLAMQAGFDSRNAVVALQMAERGIPGTRNTLEGPFGYLNLMEDSYDREALLSDIGRVWRITEVAHKPFPSGRATHGVLDALSGLIAEHSLTANTVSAVSAKVPPLTHRLIGRPVRDDMTPNYARLSGPYCAARMLLSGSLGNDDFLPEALNDAPTLELGKRIAIQAVDNPDPNALSPVTVTVERGDAPPLTATVETVYGNPAKPMTRSAHLDKFRANVHFADRVSSSTAEQLVALIDEVETVSDVRRLIDLLVP